jgi:hypothetical protein
MVGGRVPAKSVMQVTTDSVGSPSGSPGPPTHLEPSASVCGLRRNRNALAIWRGESYRLKERGRARFVPAREQEGVAGSRSLAFGLCCA